MIPEINLTLSLWGRDRKVRVASVTGSNASYHIYIDSFYHGQIFRAGGKLEIGYSKSCDLPGDDLQGLFDVLQDSPA